MTTNVAMQTTATASRQVNRVFTNLIPKKQTFSYSWGGQGSTVTSNTGGTQPLSIVVNKGVGQPLAIYDPRFAATQLLERGQVSLNRLASFVPKGTPNTFKSSSTIEFGQKYRFEINGTKVEVKFHSPDLNAAQKFPGSNSGSSVVSEKSYS